MKILLLNFSFLILLFAFCDARQPRIHHGNNARDGQFPFASMLTYLGNMFCGAAIIHPRWAITAAHCIKRNPLPGLTVGTNGNAHTGRNYWVERFYVHENYTLIPEEQNNGLEVILNDIALIRLKSDIQFSDKVKKVKLETDEHKNYENVTATIVGWGQETHWGPISQYLRYADVPVLSMSKCQKVWTYADKHICTGNKERGGCNGDSGSPLVVDGTQIGIVSTGDTYCQSIKPDLFTKVASFIPWIKSKLSKYRDTLE